MCFYNYAGRIFYLLERRIFRRQMYNAEKFTFS